MSDPGIAIRPARADEGAALADLLRVAITPYAHALGREVTPGAFSRLAAAHAKGDVHVASGGGAPLGFVELVWHDDVLEVDLLCVHPDHQKHGIGRALLADAERIARERGLPRLKLHTAAMFGHLLRFYASVGYVETHRGLQPYGADAHERVFFEKRLG